MTNEELVSLAKAGDATAYEKLFEQNRGLAHFIARKWSNVPIEHEDLVSLCWLGFVKAYRAYDTSQNVLFASFASLCANNEIRMTLRKKQLPSAYLVSVVEKKDGAEETDWEMPYVEERYEQIENRSMIQDVLTIVRDKCKKNYEQVILEKLVIGDAEQSVITTMLGLSQPYVSRIAKRMRNKLHQVAKRRGCL